MSKAEIAIIMGSRSDLAVMSEAADTIEDFAVPYEIDIVSAHRTPEKMFDYASSAKQRALQVIIAGAGGAAHLPGMVASLTTLPVIGVPIKSKHSLEGWDSILSILQMPAGIPVATVALNQAKNAALLALRILSLGDSKLSKKIQEFMKEQRESTLESAKNFSKIMQFPK